MVDFSTDDPRHSSWREEVRAFLDDAMDDRLRGFDWDYSEDDELWAMTRDFWRKAGARGWVGVTWPKELGGAGKTALENWILNEEMVNRQAPGYPGIGEQVAHHVMRLGTDEQRKQHVRGVATAEVLWGEGFTEPDSGSDLASLQTTAVRDGDEWVINGQKTFGTSAHRAEWMAVLARTDPHAPKHAGITCFLVPSNLPGMTMAPLYNLAGGRQNMTYFDNVRVPLSAQLGDLNRAWQQVWFRLGGDKLAHDPPTTGVRQARLGDVLDMVIEYCKETRRNGTLLSEDPATRAQLAELMIGVDSIRMFEFDSFWRADSGNPADYGGYLSQAFYKEFWPHFAQKCMEILGPLSIVYAGKYAPLGGAVESLYRTSFANHAGGTSQLKRMVLATRALGLPR